mmetsp:Transcript_31646/g.90844  ORF Transcript_31646/g.90844 Transcript_31646/m.90844 type:complete len:340 (+) Transcript_31646:114-1133(+)
MDEPQEEGRYTATVTANTPLFLDFRPGYKTEKLDELPEPPRKAKHFTSYRGLSLDIAKAVINLIVPPLIFIYVSSMLSFGLHFRFPRFIWLMVLVALLPAMIARLAHRKAQEKCLSTRWHKLSIALMLGAFLSAAVFGERNYWFLFHPFYVLESGKTYSNIDPSEMSGVRLMDASQVHFTGDTRLATDMGMSFTTSWDVYCVAPITTAAGLPSQGSTLAVYDVWAVGVGCCRSAEPNFRCGEFDDARARAGLRQVGDEQRRFFRLAVQQAEAAYGIEAPDPVFFHWVHDPQVQESLFFEAGFENWVLANSIHFSANLAAIVAFVLLCHKPPGDDGLPAL